MIIIPILSAGVSTVMILTYYVLYSLCDADKTQSLYFNFIEPSFPYCLFLIIPLIYSCIKNSEIRKPLYIVFGIITALLISVIYDSTSYAFIMWLDGILLVSVINSLVTTTISATYKSSNVNIHNLSTYEYWILLLLFCSIPVALYYCSSFFGESPQVSGIFIILSITVSSCFLIIKNLRMFGTFLATITIASYFKVDIDFHEIYVYLTIILSILLSAIFKISNGESNKA